MFGDAARKSRAEVYFVVVGTVSCTLFVDRIVIELIMVSGVSP